MAVTNIVRCKYTLSFGASDTTKSDSINVIGKVCQIHFRVPNWTNDVTATLTVLDEDGYEIYNSGAKNRNANYNIDREQIIPANSKIKVELSGAPGGSGGDVIVVFLGRAE